MGIWEKLKKAAAGNLSTVNPEQPSAEAITDPMEGYTDLFASELIDEHTCTNCAENDGREYTSMADARADYPDGQYPEGGYEHCTSPNGCRGTLIFLRNG